MNHARQPELEKHWCQQRGRCRRASTMNPDDAGSFGDFSDADEDAVRGSEDVTTGEHGDTSGQYGRSTDGVGVEDTDRPKR